MFRPVPNAIGCVVANVSSVDSILAVNSDLAAVLATALGLSGSDHTYLTIGEAPNCEYLRVQQVLDAEQIIVDRARDGTIAKAFPATTPLRYILTAEAVSDIISAQGTSTNVTITATSPLNVNEVSNNTFELTIDPTVITSPDNTIDVMGTYPNIQLSVVRGVTGCGC